MCGFTVKEERQFVNNNETDQMFSWNYHDITEDPGILNLLIWIYQ